MVSVASVGVGSHQWVRNVLKAIPNKLFEVQTEKNIG